MRNLFLFIILLSTRPALAQTEPSPDLVPPTATAAPTPAADNKGTVVEPPFMEVFPALKNYVYHEPPSGFFLGLGLSPLGVLKDRTVFTADFFQLHVRNERWDWQIFSASYGITRAQIPTYQSTNFTFMTAPKLRIGRILSLGPLLGYEYISFPNLTATVQKAPYTTKPDQFSSRGLIYGFMVTQTFTYREYLLELSEVGYQQTYSNIKTDEGWRYNYSDANVRANPSLVGASFVAMLKLSFLF